MKTVLKIVLVLIWLIVLGFAFNATIKKTEKFSSTWHLVSTPPFAEVPPNLIKMMFLGQKGVYDDFLHLWMMQIVTDKNAKSADPDQVSRLMKILLKQTPKIEAFYLMSCFYLSSDLKRPEDCLDISLAGLKAFPLSWRIPMTQGYIHALVLKEPVQASAFFSLAASRGDRSPPWVARLAQRLANKENITDKDVEETMDFMETVEGGDKFRDFFKHARETWAETRAQIEKEEAEKAAAEKAAAKAKKSEEEAKKAQDEEQEP